MNFFLAAVAFAGTISAFLLAMRVYHRADHPEWLDRDLVAGTVAVILTGAMVCSFSALMAAAAALPLPIWGDAAAVLATAAGIFYGVRYLFAATAGATRRRV